MVFRKLKCEANIILVMFGEVKLRRGVGKGLQSVRAFIHGVVRWCVGRSSGILPGEGSGSGGVQRGEELAETGPPGGVRTGSHETQNQTETGRAAPPGPR